MEDEYLRDRFKRAPTVNMTREEIVSLLEFHGETLQYQDLFRLRQPFRLVHQLGRDLQEIARQIKASA